VLLLIVVGIFAFGWWAGASIRTVISHPAGAPATTTATIDTERARERGAEVVERAARATAAIRETVAEAALTSKIKAKMALDDYVRARSIDVSTSRSKVTLSGRVRSTGERDRAVTLARETVGVTSVIDHLDVER
jgi:hyperosmotically inducible protein